MTEPTLETLEIEPTGPATAAVILMHGLGADANDFHGLVPEFGLPAGLHVRYVLPNAPRIPVTINQGLIMRAWYDITGVDTRAQDEARIRQSARWIDELVTREVARGVPADRIVVAGFSQGGAMALFTGVRSAARLAGLMCLSGYLLLGDTLPAEASDANRDVPIFMAHGTADPMVPIVLARSSYETLVDADYPVEWHDYAMAHQVSLDEVRDIGDWLTRILTRPSESG